MPDAPSSPLLQMFPVLAYMMPDGTELCDDLNRLLSYLHPYSRDDVLYRSWTLAYAFVINHDGTLRQLRQSRWRAAWREEAALSARLDALVARDQVRALAVCRRVMLRRSDGLHDSEELGLHMLFEHRAGFSGDFVAPLKWGPIRERGVGEPSWVDRAVSGRAYRRWPTADSVRSWPPWHSEDREPDDKDAVEDAYDNYRRQGNFNYLLRAIDIMDDRLRAIPGGDERWPDAADRLAALLTTRFRHSGLDGDLERGLTLSRTAVERGGRRSLHRARLAEVMGLRFVARGRLADLDAALGEARAACSEHNDEPDRSQMAEIFMELLVLAYRATGDRDHLAEAAALLAAVGPEMENQEGHISVRLAAGASATFLHAFQEAGDREDIERAVTWSRWAVSAIPVSDPEYAWRLRDLGAALTTSYELSKDESELEQAYLALDSALARTHDSAPERPSIELALVSARVHRLSRARLIPLLEAQGYERESLEEMEEAGLSPVGVMLAREASLGEWLLHRLPEGSAMRPEVLSLLATLYRDQFSDSSAADRPQITTKAARLDFSSGVDRLQTAASMAGLAAAEWEAFFANSSVAQKLGASRSTGQLYAFAVDAYLELARIAEKADPADMKSGFRTGVGGMTVISPPVSVTGAHDRAFLMAETAKARLLTEQLSRGELTAPPRVPQRLLQRERALIAELTEIDTAAIAARGSGISIETDGERHGQLLANLDKVWTSIGKHGSRAAEYVSLRRKDTPDLRSIGEVVLAEREDTVVLSMYVLESHTALFSAPSDGAGSYAVDEIPISTKTWGEALRRFARELPSSHGQDLLPNTWEMPLRPLLEKAAERGRGYSRVVLAPHGSAGALPWTFLTRDWESRRGGPPAISIVPSLTLLGYLQKRPPPRTQQAVVIGNPTGDLAHAELEALTVSSVLGVEPILGPAADTAAMNAAAPEARILHLAAHAAFDSASPADSYVLLSDARWSARQALRCRLDAELVVLSGCETGILGSLAGEELIGMAYAFLHAGARAVIVSLWPISDAATAEFMGTFHRLYRTGTSASEALRQTATEVRRTHEHPWYWAAFALIGGHG